MTSERLRRDLRHLARDLDLIFLGEEPAGMHHKMRFASADGRTVTIPVPKGIVSEGGHLVKNIRRQLERIAK